MEDSDDLNRDVLKGDTASVEIPCLEFSMEGGAEAGERFLRRGSASSRFSFHSSCSFYSQHISVLVSDSSILFLFWPLLSPHTAHPLNRGISRVLSRLIFAGTLTTVEGLLKSLADGLSDSIPFASGDSAAEASKKRMDDVRQKLRDMQEGHASVLPFKLIINDPADMSFVALRTEEEFKKAPVVQVDASTHVDGDAAKALAAAAAAAAKAPGAVISDEELGKKLKEAKPGEVLWSSKLDETLVRLVDRC